MCLFNPEVLRQKVQDALLVLEAMNEEPESRSVSSPVVTREYSDSTTIESRTFVDTQRLHSFSRFDFSTILSSLDSFLDPTLRPTPRISNRSSTPSRNLDSLALETLSCRSRSNQRIHELPPRFTSVADQTKVGRETLQSDQIHWS